MNFNPFFIFVSSSLRFLFIYHLFRYHLVRDGYFNQAEVFIKRDPKLVGYLRFSCVCVSVCPYAPSIKSNKFDISLRCHDKVFRPTGSTGSISLQNKLSSYIFFLKSFSKTTPFYLNLFTK